MYLPRHKRGKKMWNLDGHLDAIDPIIINTNDEDSEDDEAYLLEQDNPN